MKDKIIFWLSENRTKIGYTLGALNVISGVSLIATGNTANGLIQLFLGSVLIFDAWMMA